MYWQAANAKPDVALVDLSAGSRACGPGCRFISCKNLPTKDGPVDSHSGDDEDDSIETENSDSKTEDDHHDSTDSIMESVFGRENEY